MVLSINRLRSSLFGKQRTPVATAADLFQAPPFTEAYADAVSKISTRLRIEANDRSRGIWQAESNAASKSEWNAIQPLVTALPKPQRILEVGPGMGRSIVYFGKSGLWDSDAQIDLYDANGLTTKYKQRYYDSPPAWPDVSSFCGNLHLLAETLRFNGVENFRILDAAAMPLRDLPGPYDLIYAAYSIGFHWSLEHYLDDLEPLLGPNTVLICTLNKHFHSFAGLERFSTRTLPMKGEDGLPSLNMLALSRPPLPQ